MEGKEWAWNNGILVEKDVEEIKEEIEKAYVSAADRETVLLSAFNRWLNKF